MPFLSGRLSFAVLGFVALALVGWQYSGRWLAAEEWLAQVRILEEENKGLRLQLDALQESCKSGPDAIAEEVSRHEKDSLPVRNASSDDQSSNVGKAARGGSHKQSKHSKGMKKSGASPEEVGKLLKDMDADGDGKLSPEEIQDSHERLAGFSLPEVPQNMQTPIMFTCILAFFGPLAFKGLRLWREWQEFQLISTSDDEFSSFIGYHVDLWVSTTPRWREIILVSSSLAIVTIGGVGYSMATGLGLSESMLSAWLFMVDTAAHGNESHTCGWIVGFIVTICGMLVSAMLISILTDGLQEFLELMRRGRSRVICSGHVLILGWSEKIVTILEELAEANSSEGGGTIVILTELEKRECENNIKYQLANSQSVFRQRGMRGTTWVVRSGNPMLIADLKMVSVELAKCIIILSDTSLHQSDSSDKRTLQILLGLLALQQEKQSTGSIGEVELQSRELIAEMLANVHVSSEKEHSSDQTAHVIEELNDLMSCPTAGSSLADSARKTVAGLGEAVKSIADTARKTVTVPSLIAPPAPAIEKPQQHFVVEMTDIDSVPLVEALGSGRTEVVVAPDIAHRLLVHGSQQEGLSRVIESISGFDGPEFYIEHWPDLVGKTFADVAFAFENAIPVGVVSGEGERILNPDDDYVIEADDRITVLAEDNDTYQPHEVDTCVAYDKARDFVKRPIKSKDPEEILICGWRRDFGDMITELDAAVSAGSVVTVMSTVDTTTRDSDMIRNKRSNQKPLNNLRLVHHVGDPTMRRDLEQLAINKYDSVIVIADEENAPDVSSKTNTMASDGLTIATVLLILDIRRTMPEIKGGNPVRVTIELLDTRTRQMVRTTGLSDYIMSQNIIASVLANVAESSEVNGIINEILTWGGNRLFLHPAELCLQDPDETCTFWQLTARARAHREVLCGYWEKDLSIVINPANRNVPRTWSGCTLVVLAKDSGQETNEQDTDDEEEEPTSYQSGARRSILLKNQDEDQDLSPYSARKTSRVHRLCRMRYRSKSLASIDIPESLFDEADQPTSESASPAGTSHIPDEQGSVGESPTQSRNSSKDKSVCEGEASTRSRALDQVDAKVKLQQGLVLLTKQDPSSLTSFLSSTEGQQQSQSDSARASARASVANINQNVLDKLQQQSQSEKDASRSLRPSPDSTSNAGNGQLKDGKKVSLSVDTGRPPNFTSVSKPKVVQKLPTSPGDQGNVQRLMEDSPQKDAWLEGWLKEWRALQGSEALS